MMVPGAHKGNWNNSTKKDTRMKLTLFLFLFLAGSLLAGRAMAQGCSTAPIAFPPPGDADIQVAPGTCIANADRDSPTGQGGRLRWDDNGNNELVLFDSEHGGIFLWCDGQSDSSTTCIPGNILCLQADGNMVIYSGNGISCTGNHGKAVWSSKTLGDNDSQERLTVEENVVCGGVQRSGERAVIRNASGVQFCSLGYVDNDPN
jgi:hypothetical protein